MIREACPSDMPFVIHRYGVVQHTEGIATDFETNDAQLAEWYEDESLATILVAGDHGDPYGCIVVRYEMPGTAIVGGLYVEPGSPKRTALELLERAARECAARGVTNVRIVTGETQHATYPRIGFRPVVTVWEASLAEAHAGIARRLNR